MILNNNFLNAALLLLVTTATLPGQETTATPGSATSGKVTPGKVTPGKVTAGNVTPGTATQGNVTGGSATGGSAVGGTTTGGDVTGGTVIGGSATGGSAQGAAAMAGEESAAAAMPGNPPVVPEGVKHFMAILRPTEGDRVSGSIQVDRKPDELELRLKVEGLEPGTRISVGSHVPRAVVGPGERARSMSGNSMRIEFPKEDLVADEQGRVMASAVMKDPDAISQLAGRIVALHRDARNASADAASLQGDEDPLALGTFEPTESAR